MVRTLIVILGGSLHLHFGLPKIYKLLAWRLNRGKQRGKSHLSLRLIKWWLNCKNCVEGCEKTPSPPSPLPPSFYNSLLAIDLLLFVSLWLPLISYLSPSLFSPLCFPSIAYHLGPPSKRAALGFGSLFGGLPIRFEHKKPLAFGLRVG